PGDGRTGPDCVVGVSGRGLRPALPAPAGAGRSVSSIYRRALGSAFERLHPQIQRRFGFASQDGFASIGTGRMEEVWRGPVYTLPFLAVGAWRHIMFPATG